MKRMRARVSVTAPTQLGSERARERERRREQQYLGYAESDDGVHFEKLLRKGVRLFEYPHTLLHQKVMTVDGVWSAVGSTNFDDRSFETNDELTLGILDAATAGQLDAIFERYVKRASEIKVEKWVQRSIGHKLKDYAAYSIHGLL